jgi:hypothetical protein
MGIDIGYFTAYYALRFSPMPARKSKFCNAGCHHGTIHRPESAQSEGSFSK